MTADFSSVLFTSEDKALLVSELEILKRNLYSAHPTFTNLSALGISDQTHHFWKNVMGQEQVTAAGLESLRQSIGQSTLARLTVPTPIERPDIQSIVSLLRKQSGTANLFVEVEVDESLVAGVQLSMNGKRIDMSLVKKLHQIDLKGIIHKYVPLGSPETL